MILRIGAPDIAATLRATLKSRLTPLLEGAVANPFVYEPVWGGIVAHDSLLSVWIDCTCCTAPFAPPSRSLRRKLLVTTDGAGQYNDHHFHWGYILNCVAAVAKADPAWGRKHSAPLLDLVRDIASPVGDAHFPPHRYLDLWAGHSWASGVGLGAKNQESSSEAVNAYVRSLCALFPAFPNV